MDDKNNNWQSKTKNQKSTSTTIFSVSSLIVPYSLQYIKNYMDSDGVLETNYEDENNREINVVENRITELLTAKRGLNH